MMDLECYLSIRSVQYVLEIIEPFLATVKNNNNKGTLGIENKLEIEA